MNTHTNNTTALLAALAALTLTGATLTEARTRVSETPVTIQALSREQINASGSENVTDVLNQTPGITTDQYAGNPYTTNNRVNLRGLGNNRSLVLLNGRRYNPNPDTYGTTGQIIPTDMAQVEILRGPQGTLYGRNTAGYKFNDLRLETGVKFDPKALSTAGADPTIEYNPETDNPQTWGTNLGTTTDTVNTTTDTTTDTPCPQTTANNTTDTPQTPAVETTSSTPSAYYGGKSEPCPKVRIDWNKVADHLRRDSADQATYLNDNSQPRPFYDFNDYKTAGDELSNRAAIGYQLSQTLSMGGAYNQNAQGCIRGPGGVPNAGLPPAGGTTYLNPEGPKTYYRIGFDYPVIPIGQDDSTTTDKHADSTTSTGSTTTESTKEPPLPEYKPVVKPINTHEMSDRELQLEIKYGPSIAAGYQREANDLRSDSARYRKWAKQRREQAARARTDAEDARERAKKAKKADDREFWEQQAEAYDSQAKTLEDSAHNLDRSAEDNDAAAKTYEQDAAQSAANAGQAAGELSNRQAQRAVDAARAQAARDAEAERREAERQRQLQELIQRSQQSTQSSNTNKQPTPRRATNEPYHPDGREPHPGKEPRNETLRKLLD